MVEEEWEAYAALWDEHMDANNRVHQLLGHAAPNQPASIWVGYEHARRAFYDPTMLDPYPLPFPSHWQQEFARHRPLLQVSEEDNGMWFGREGRLCTLIDEDNLAAGDLSRAWVAV